MEVVDAATVISQLQSGKTYKQVAQFYGVNVNTLISWCKKRNIKKREVRDPYVKAQVELAVKEVGTQYGRRMLNGYVKSKGIAIGERKTLQLLHVVTPNATAERRAGVRVTNPTPYRATHFGHKLHFDQNEKLYQYGVFHAACIDGFSSKIIRHIILHQKNPILLYDKLFKPILHEYGLWDSVRVDYGTEWYLILNVQQTLEHYRTNRQKPSYTQSFSKKNLRIERWWVEVNKRVNYPLKAILHDMEEENLLPNSSDDECFFVGEFVRRLCQVGVDRLVAAWNHHRIDGRGVPANAASVGTGVVPDHAVMSPEYAAQCYGQQGGQLTTPSASSLINDDMLEAARDEAFAGVNGSFAQIYSSTINGDQDCFKAALHSYVQLSLQFKPV